MIRMGLAEEVKKLDWCLQQARWLETDAGDDWAWDNYGREVDVPVGEDDIVEHLLSEVLTEAGRHTNKAIRKFQGVEEWEQ